jgi:hypothetical protein
MIALVLWPIPEKNLNWFLVLLIAIAGAVLGTIIPKAYGVAMTATLKDEVWNECIVATQFAYFGYYASLLTAFDLTIFYRNLSVLCMILAFVYFMAGFLNMRSRAAAHAPKAGIIVENAALAALSFLCATMIIFSTSLRDAKG